MPARVGILSSQRGYHVLELEEAIRNKGYEPVFYDITRLASWIGKVPARSGALFAALTPIPKIE